MQSSLLDYLLYVFLVQRLMSLHCSILTRPFFLALLQDLSFENGLTIPAGAVLVVPVQLVQVDNSKWGSDASKFNPYRFLSKEYDLLTDEQG